MLLDRMAQIVRVNRVVSQNFIQRLTDVDIHNVVFCSVAAVSGTCDVQRDINKGFVAVWIC